MATTSGTMNKLVDKLEHGGGEPEEGKMTKAIEKQTAKVPSIGFLALAVVSMLASLGLAVGKKRELANFVGLWAPTLLVIGIYNKLVKLQGSD